MASEAGVAMQREPTEKEIRMVIGASSAGTVFEWYDFFIYGTLFYIIGPTFSPAATKHWKSSSSGRHLRLALVSARLARCCLAISVTSWDANTRSLSR